MGGVRATALTRLVVGEMNVARWAASTTEKEWE
jgi:hypothetical protein